MKPFSILKEIIKAARPVHWIKNLSIFAALIFSGNLSSKVLFNNVFFAFIIFSLATSATYIFNDILDANMDRLHPIKKNRPVASGKLPVPIALIAMSILVISALFLASGYDDIFFLSVAGYITLQVLYSLGLKNIEILDIIIIAAGFIIRVYAGAFIINAHLSVWFLLCVISTSLFLASGKRRAELGIIEGTNQNTRKSLSRYTRPLLDSYVTMFGNTAWLSWALFTFFESPSTPQPLWLYLAEISRTTTISKLMMITIPITIFGIMRYESLIFRNETEAPEKLLLTDVPLVASISVWVLSIILILYGGIPNIG